MTCIFVYDSQSAELKQKSERLNKCNVGVIVVAIGDDVDDEECQYVTCGSHPIINIAPEQNPRAVVYSIVGELEEGLFVAFVTALTDAQNVCPRFKKRLLHLNKHALVIFFINHSHLSSFLHYPIVFA